MFEREGHHWLKVT